MCSQLFGTELARLIDDDAAYSVGSLSRLERGGVRAKREKGSNRLVLILERELEHTTGVLEAILSTINRRES